MQWILVLHHLTTEQAVVNLCNNWKKYCTVLSICQNLCISCGDKLQSLVFPFLIVKNPSSDPESTKDSGSPPKYKLFLLAPWPTGPLKLTKIVNNFFSYLANRQTDRETTQTSEQTDRQMDRCCHMTSTLFSGGNNDYEIHVWHKLASYYRLYSKRHFHFHMFYTYYKKLNSNISHQIPLTLAQQLQWHRWILQAPLSEACGPRISWFVC